MKTWETERQVAQRSLNAIDHCLKDGRISDIARADLEKARVYEIGRIGALDYMTAQDGIA